MLPTSAGNTDPTFNLGAHDGRVITALVHLKHGTRRLELVTCGNIDGQVFIFDFRRTGRDAEGNVPMPEALQSVMAEAQIAKITTVDLLWLGPSINIRNLADYEEVGRIMNARLWLRRVKGKLCILDLDGLTLGLRGKYAGVAGSDERAFQERQNTYAFSKEVKYQHFSSFLRTDGEPIWSFPKLRKIDVDFVMHRHGILWELVDVSPSDRWKPKI